MDIPDKTIVNIFGNPCTGKSTLVEKITANQDGLYCVDYDVVKRQISGYYWKRDSEFARGLTRDFLKLVVGSGRPIVSLLAMARSEEEYAYYFEPAVEAGYQVINVKLFVERKTLIERYKMRLASIARENPGLRVKTLEEFIAYIDQPTFVPDDTYIIDGGMHDADAVYGEFGSILKD